MRQGVPGGPFRQRAHAVCRRRSRLHGLSPGRGAGAPCPDHRFRSRVELPGRRSRRVDRRDRGLRQRPADRRCHRHFAGSGLRHFRRRFRPSIRDPPRLARSVIHLLCRRLRATTDQLEGIALHKIEVRLARFLLGLLGQRTAPPGRRLSLELGYSQSELARLVGSSRSKLNMALGVLEDAGAIKRTSDRLFCDPAMLAQFADSADD
ncbi:Crp/Fnr family transcriptional regulator [Oleomonas cavernae]|uniref:Crp/Fnr family transcriptional regulator n=1 Tax=Oleomonas cavernae TaxID=2320859 RepID=A0A418WSS5_9PROT|nr:Crp/Fnr family transcriptional regulator [Oleomonas cavernae]